MFRSFVRNTKTMETIDGLRYLCVPPVFGGVLYCAVTYVFIPFARCAAIPRLCHVGFRVSCHTSVAV